MTLLTMLKNITWPKVFAISLLLLLVFTGCKPEMDFDSTVNLPKETPIGFTSYVNEGLGVSFYYATDWGTPIVADGGEGIYQISFAPGPLTPNLTLITKKFPDKSGLNYRQFLTGPKEDCERLTQENNLIVNEYLARDDAEKEANLSSVLPKNSFFCEVTKIANVAALISYNPIKIESDPEEETAQPVPIPVVDYRLVLPKNPDYQAVNASLLVFDNLEGTTYQDYKKNMLAADRTKAIKDFKQLMDSLIINKIDDDKLELIQQDSNKRRRPVEEANAKIYNDNDFVSFSYPSDWQVKKIVNNALEIWPNSLEQKDIAPVQIKILANAERKDLQSFLSDSVNLTGSLSGTAESVRISGQIWEKRTNLKGVYNLDLYFTAKNDYVVEVDAFSESESSYTKEITAIISSLQTK